MKSFRRARWFIIAIVAVLLVLVLYASMPNLFVPNTSVIKTGTSVSQQDYETFVSPYLSNLEKIREVLMQPYTIGNQYYGYNSAVGLTCGGNIEASPAIGVSNGYNNACVIIDNNLEGGCALDYFNSAKSVLSSVSGWQEQNTNICGTVRQYLGGTWYGVGGCSAPFTTFSYPSSFSLLDQREPEYGFSDPYASTLIQPGVHIGGIGLSCGIMGQVWYLQGFDKVSNSATSPLIVTELPNGQSVGPTADLEELSFYIDETYMQCIAGTASCSLWQTAYHNAMIQYGSSGFIAPREALHFIQATRATGAWLYTNSSFSYNGMTALQMAQSALTKLFTSTANGGATGVDGGLTQQWGGGSSDTPEPNFQALIALDPEMPSWFTSTAFHACSC